MFKRFLAGLVCVAVLGLTTPLGSSPTRAEDAALDLPPPPPPPPPPAATPEPETAKPETSRIGDTPAKPVATDNAFSVPVPPAPATAAPVALPAGAGSGRIVSGRVNIRSGPSTRYEIVATLNENTPVAVLAQTDEWVKIGYPGDVYCFISQEFLAGNIPADIPETGLTMTVSGDNVQLRVRPWEKSTVIGQVAKGESVVVTGLRGRWARIKPTPGCWAWVFAKYVKFEGEVAKETLPADAAPPPATGPEAAPEKGKRSEVAKEADKDMEKRLAAARERFEREQQQRKAEVQKVVDSVDDELAKMDQEAEAKKSGINRQTVQVDVFDRRGLSGEVSAGGYTGWVEYVGQVGKRPAAFRLVRGGEVMFYLRSTTQDLAQFVNRMVAVDGTVELAPGFEANVMEVAAIRLLSEGPASVRDQQPDIRRPYTRPDSSYTPSTPAVTPAPAGGPVTLGAEEKPAAVKPAAPAPAAKAGATGDDIDRIIQVTTD